MADKTPLGADVDLPTLFTEQQRAQLERDAYWFEKVAKDAGGEDEAESG